MGSASQDGEAQLLEAPDMALYPNSSYGTGIGGKKRSETGAAEADGAATRDCSERSDSGVSGHECVAFSPESSRKGSMPAAGSRRSSYCTLLWFRKNRSSGMFNCIPSKIVSAPENTVQYAPFTKDPNRRCTNVYFPRPHFKRFQEKRYHWTNNIVFRVQRLHRVSLRPFKQTHKPKPGHFTGREAP